MVVLVYQRVVWQFFWTLYPASKPLDFRCLAVAVVIWFSQSWRLTDWRCKMSLFNGCRKVANRCTLLLQCTFKHTPCYTPLESFFIISPQYRTICHCIPLYPMIPYQWFKIWYTTLCYLMLYYYTILYHTMLYNGHRQPMTFPSESDPPQSPCRHQASSADVLLEAPDRLEVGPGWTHEGCKPPLVGA